MNSGREGCPMAMGSHFEGDAFMRTDLIADPRTWIDVCQRFYSSIDQYNIHFLQHLWHAYALLGVFHPLEVVQWHSMQFYLDGAKKLHFNPETRDEITYRLRDGIRPESDE
jgi:hypothetical protein